jgi:hypothetical protein
MIDLPPERTWDELLEQMDWHRLRCSLCKEGDCPDMFALQLELKFRQEEAGNL